MISPQFLKIDRLTVIYRWLKGKRYLWYVINNVRVTDFRFRYRWDLIMRVNWRLEIHHVRCYQVLFDIQLFLIRPTICLWFSRYVIQEVHTRLKYKFNGLVKAMVIHIKRRKQSIHIRFGVKVPSWEFRLANSLGYLIIKNIIPCEKWIFSKMITF